MKNKALVLLLTLIILLSSCNQKENLKANPSIIKTFSEVSVHDPAIVAGQDGDYYIFGSHLAVAKTNDLMNWEQINQGVKNNNTVIPNVYFQMEDAFTWAKTNTFWAPEVIKLKNGKYAMYYCNCKGDEPLSAMGIAYSDNIEGPYENQGIILKSGNSDNEDEIFFNGATEPNTVDACVFYDAEDRLWMIYGSYSGGIFAKELNPLTGFPLEEGYGDKILGGNHLRIEAPYVIYNPDNKYYYMFLSFGGLDSDGGYNIRVCRSKTPNGDYKDSMGQDMLDCKGQLNSSFDDNAAMIYGTKLMGNYKFEYVEGEEGEDRNAYLSPGHNSILYQPTTNKYFIIYHTRFENRGEEHEVRVHQIFFNEDDWPVIAPYRYTGEAISTYQQKDLTGNYKLIQHGRKISSNINYSTLINLDKNGKITGDVSGTWEFSGDYNITLNIEDDIYKGVFLKQWDEDGNKYAMTFTALCENKGLSIWGSSLNALNE